LKSALLRGAIWGLVCGGIAGSLVVGVELGGLGTADFLVLAVVFFLVVPICGIALLLAAFAKLRRRALQVFVSCSVFALGVFAPGPAAGHARSHAFARLADRSAPLIAAIRRYESIHGHPPDVLDDLVPALLPEVPATEMPAYPAYEYEVFPKDAARLLHWYDLGSRDGESFVGLWKHIDGDADHAILVMATDRDGTVVQVDADRLPQTFAERAFDRSLWAQRAERMSMVRDLAKTLDPMGKPFERIADVLGPADGFYWPTEDYPDYAYGGSIERIRNWAYVHE